MHILIALLGILGAGAFWWYRLKYMGDAAGEVVDKIGQVRGSMRRSKLRKQASLSPLTAVDDPVVAAATIITAIVTDDKPLTEARETALREAIAGLSDTPKADESVIYAKWAAAQIDDTNVVIDKLAPLLRDRLDPGEKEDFLVMTRGIVDAEPNDPPRLTQQNLRRLRQKLGLQID